MLWFKRDTTKDDIIFRLMEIIEKQFMLQDERLQKLMGYVKPDTVVKLQGMNELKREFQRMIQFEEKRIRDKVEGSKETTMLNKLGE